MKANLISLVLIFSCIAANAQNYAQPTGAGAAGTNNTSLGSAAGDNVGGDYNTFVGMESGKTNSSTAADYNSFFGSRSGYSVTSGANNSFFGYQAGYSGTTGTGNTYLGYRAGYSNLTGTGNVFIGKDAGYSETGSNKLYISNSQSSALIRGDFSTNQVAVNAPIGTYTFEVGGSLNASSLFIAGQAYKPSQWTTSGSNISYAAGGVTISAASLPATYKLAVGGGIVAEEVLVKLQANWPDYVFDKQYGLMSLTDLEQYIATHRHLPDVPSASEVKDNGVKLGEMEAILLKKIEELTLHLIELKRQSDEQSRLIKELQK